MLKCKCWSTTHDVNVTWCQLYWQFLHMHRSYKEINVSLSIHTRTYTLSQREVCTPRSATTWTWYKTRLKAPQGFQKMLEWNRLGSVKVNVIAVLFWPLLANTIVNTAVFLLWCKLKSTTKLWECCYQFITIHKLSIVKSSEKQHKRNEDKQWPSFVELFQDTAL